MGAPILAHWGLADPADVAGSDDDVDAAFAETARLLTLRIEAMLALPIESMAPRELASALNSIGQMEGAA